MKKTLLILISLILCLSFTFTACNTEVEFGDDETNGATEENKPTEDTRPAPSGVDKSIAQSSLNKIDLSTLIGSTESSFDIFADIVAGLDLTAAGVIDGEEGKATIKAAIEEGKIYYALSSESEGDVDLEEAFVKLYGKTADLFEKVDDKWQLIDSVTLEDMLVTDEEFLESTLKGIKIPELKDEYLTEKNGMLVVSNQYVIDVIDANAALIAGYEITAEEKAEILNSANEIIKALGVEISIGTGYDKIVKLAVTVAPSAEMAEDMGIKSAKAELALDNDATYLKSASLSVELAAEEGIDYASKISATLNSIVVDGKLQGFDLKAGFAMPTASAAEAPGWEFDEDGNYIIDGEIVTEYEYSATRTFSEIAIDAKIDLSKLATVGAEVASLKVDYKPAKAFKVTYKENLETYETTVVSVEEVEPEDFSVSVNGTVKTTAENVASIAGEVVVGEEKVTISGSFSYGTVEFPEIPADIKNYFD